MDMPIIAQAGNASPLEIRGLTKIYVENAVVNSLDLTIRPGELYALLGPNGAGKTTTMRMVAGLLEPTNGSISVFGVDALAEPLRAKQLIAWLPDEPLLYDKLTVLEYLEFVAALWSVPPEIAAGRAEELLRGLELWDNRGDRCETFSRGMKQKAVLAGALLHDPQLMLLDEPLTGLDASIARHVKDMLQERARSGHSVILTTHILEVAERLADRIGIIANGRLLAEGTLEELRARAGAGQSSLEDVFLHLVAEPAGT